MRDWRFRALLALLVVYGAGLLAFPPTVVLNSDEALYVRQAVAYAAGERLVQVRDPATREAYWELPSNYPPGTSLLQTPFVWVGGWKAASGTSFVALAVVIFLTATWLRRLGLRPTFAALVPLFIPISVLARTGMSDLPSAAVVLASMFLLAMAPARTPMAAGGFLAGLSVLFRDSNPIFIAPTVVKSLIRRERVALLLVSILAGVGVRLVLAAMLQGDALTLRAPYTFTFSEAAARALLYGFALTVLVPGGLLAVALYRGPGRALLVVSVAVPFLFFTLYSYWGQDSGFLRSLILGPRYVIPLVPLTAIAVASLLEGWRASERVKRVIELLVLAAAAIVVTAVHPVLHRWSERQATLVNALLQTTSPEAVLVTEPGAIAKYLNGLDGQRTIAEKLESPPEKLVVFLSHGPVQLVFIDRTDSEYWRSMTEQNARYLADVSKRCELRPRIDVTSIDRLRVWDVILCH
jgi:4-amino-4-deoxy-L-arabinose transferase-like glycosyltransferase